MWKSVFRVTAATALFAVVHSVLAGRGAKRRAARALGERRRNALYRPLYNAQSVLTFGALALYCARQPGRELYRVRGPAALLMRLGQLASVAYLLWGTRQIGFLRFGGVTGLAAWLAGERFIPAEPEGQGPALDAGGRMKATGPFALSRHPLNFSMLPLVWLAPRMTTKLAAFNCVTTIYLVLGSLREEARLRETYGQAYVEYRQSGVPFLLPVRGENLLGAGVGRIRNPWAARTLTGNEMKSGGIET